MEPKVLRKRVCNTFQIQQQCGQDTHINIKHTDYQEGVHASMQSPIFNINIHVPPYQGDNLKMYLPRLQPVIHLHFDDLANQLKISSQQNKDVTYRPFKKLSTSMPKFGDVRFHFEEEDNETVNRIKEFQCEDKINETINKNNESSRTSPSFSFNYSNGADAHASENSESFENRFSDNCGMPDSCGSQDDSDDYNISDDTMSEGNCIDEETLKDKFNLKEVVVVLEDVCKTEYYKNMVAAGYLRNSTEDSESECDVDVEGDDLLGRKEGTKEQENMFSRTQEYRNCFIKLENECLSPESGSWSGGKSVGDNVNLLNTSQFMPSTSDQMLHTSASSFPAEAVTSIQSASNTGVTDDSEKSLYALAKGCNFSNFLSRFQIKKNEKSQELGNNEDCNYNKRVRELSLFDDPVMRETRFYGRTNSDNPTQNGGTPPDIEDCRESFTETTESGGNSNMLKEISPEDAVLQFPPNELNLDNTIWTSEEVTSKSRLETILALSPTFYKRILMFPETRENRFVNLGVSGVRFDVLEQKMGRSNDGRTGRNLKKKAVEMNSSKPSKESTSPKKMKKSNDESKKSHLKPVEMDDYIPLQASGPTKFAVAPLDKVNPYKSHDARKFKADMLYGKRINRFSSSDQLRILRLKQEAAKTQSH